VSKQARILWKRERKKKSARKKKKRAQKKRVEENPSGQKPQTCHVQQLYAENQKKKPDETRAHL
jgi:hypothetical protein